MHRVAFIAAATAAACAAFAPARAATPPPKATTYALLIGISDYPRFDPAWPALGAQRDLGLLADALVIRGVPREHQTQLRNHEATRAGIVTAFDQLADRASPGDHLLVHFSGHGQRVPDDDGDEADGYDEALVPWGAARAHADDANALLHLRDDQLATLIDALRSAVGPTGSVAITIDACHSGGATRTPTRADAPVRSRGAGTSGPPPAPEPLLVASPGASPLVVMAAARPGQSAREVRGVDGLPVGAFSSALAQALSRPGPTADWSAVHQRVRTTLSHTARGQQSSLLGDAGHAVFDGTPATAAPHYTVAGVAGGELRIAAGALHGIRPGATVELHDAEATGPAPDTLVLRGDILRASGASAWLALPNSPPDADALTSAKVFLIHSPPSATALAVRIRVTDPALAQQWRDRLRASPLMFEADAHDGGDAALSLVQHGSQLELRAGPTDPPLLTQPIDAPAADMAGLLHRQASAHHLASFQLDAAAYAVNLDLIHAAPGQCAPGAPIHADPTHGLTLTAGDTVRLQLSGAADRATYVTVAHIDATGVVTVLIPEDGAAPALLPAGQSWSPPPCWTLSPPYGEERLRVFATRQPIDLRAILGARTRGDAPEYERSDGYTTDLMYTLAPRPMAQP